jgi:hypothetical protein
MESIMDEAQARQLQGQLLLGLVDDEYPLRHGCVQLPNGWYGVNSVIGAFAEILSGYEYDELLLPTISTKALIERDNDFTKDFDVREVLPITHTGLHKLPDPYSMGLRPDLVIPQIEQFHIRSYRDLPSRIIMTGFRYRLRKSVTDDIGDSLGTDIESPDLDVSLVNDIEYPALDAVGTFANETDYLAEISKVTQSLSDFLTNKLNLSTFTVESGDSVVYCSILPNGQVLEVCRVRKFGQTLAGRLRYTVLQPDNKPAPPFIFNLNITSKLFVAVVAAHSAPDRILLPTHCLRAFGTSFGADMSGLTGLRIDVSKLAFTPERFTKVSREGQLFALVADGENVRMVTASGEEAVGPGEVRGKIEALLQAHDDLLGAKEVVEFQARLQSSVQYVTEKEAVPPEFVIVGTIPGAPNVAVAAKPFIPFD